MKGDVEGIEVRVEDDSVWLTQKAMAELYGCSRTNVLEHIQHVYADAELEESATFRKIRQVWLTEWIFCINGDREGTILSDIFMQIQD